MTSRATARHRCCFFLSVETSFGNLVLGNLDLVAFSVTAFLDISLLLLLAFLLALVKKQPVIIQLITVVVSDEYFNQRQSTVEYQPH